MSLLSFQQLQGCSPRLPWRPSPGTWGAKGAVPTVQPTVDPEIILAYLPRTGVKSPGLSALLEAKGLMEGRTMRAKESSRTCQTWGWGHPIPPLPMRAHPSHGQGN